MERLLQKATIAIAISLSFSTGVLADDLKISMYADITGLDPHDTSDNVSYSVQSGIFERLFQFDSNMKLHPQLATGYTSNDDATEFTITLREGVKFQDGTPFNSESVKANLSRLGDQTKGLKRNSLYKMIDSVDIINNHTVKVKLNQSFGAFINTLAHPSAVMWSPKVLKAYPKEAELRLHPVGTGPFIFEEWNPGKDVKLVKNESYWQAGWPKVDSVTFFPAPEDSTRVASLKSGQVDAVYPLPADLVNTVREDQNLSIQRDPSIYLMYMAINTQHKELSDVRVRQALNYALDRNLWLKVNAASMGVPAHSAMAPNVQFYKKQSSPDYSYNPEMAKKLLKEAGYENGLELKLWTSNSTPRVRTAQFVKQQLAQVGIKVTVVPMDSGTRNAKLWSIQDPKKAEFDLYYGGWSPSTGDADWALRPLFASESWTPTSYNVSYYSNDGVDKAIMGGLKTANLMQRANSYAKAQELIWKEAPVVFMGTPDNLVGKKKTLAGVSMLADGSLLFNQAKFN